MRASAYFRVSTSLQAKRGSIASQKLAVRRYAEANGIQIVREFEDNGVSGADIDRAGYKQMMANLSDVDGIIVFDASRLFSDSELEQCCGFVFQLKGAGKRLILVQSREIFDFNDPFKLVAIMMKSIMNAKHRERIGAQVSVGILRAQEKRGYWGRPKKDIDVAKCQTYLAQGLTDAEVAVLMGVSIKTMKRRLQEAQIQAGGQA